MTFNIEAFSKVPFQLGEGPHWHPKYDRLYFVDLLDGVAATIDESREVQVLLKEEGAVVSAVLPVDSKPDQVVVSVGTSIYLANTATGEKTLLDKLDKEGVRFNDAKCDPQGNLWIGTMALESSPGVLEPEKGSLYIRPQGGKLTEKMDKVSLSNGLAWSLDGRSFYYIDSVKRLIYLFDFDGKTNGIDNRRVLVNMNNNEAFTANELPDGMTIDASGNLWVAMFNGSRIVNIDGQSGKVIQSIQMPTSMITSVCFGGPNLDQLFVTSASKPLDAERKAKEPLAGFIFRITSSEKAFRGHKANFDLKL